MGVLYRGPSQGRIFYWGLLKLVCDVLVFASYGEHVLRGGGDGSTMNLHPEDPFQCLQLKLVNPVSRNPEPV